MRHFYTDANYCCVSQSFIHEGGLLSLGGFFFFFLPAPRKCSFTPPCHAAERDVSLQEWRGDRCNQRNNTSAARSTRRVQFKSTELCISAADIITERPVSVEYLHFPVSDKPWPCWRPRSIDYLQMPTDVQLMPIIVTFTERSLAAGSIIILLLLLVLFNKEIAHITVPEIKPPYFSNSRAFEYFFALRRCKHAGITTKRCCEAKMKEPSISTPSCGHFFV